MIIESILSGNEFEAGSVTTYLEYAFHTKTKLQQQPNIYI